MNIGEVKEQLKKEAQTFEIGGFRPTGELTASVYGDVKVCKEGESWPITKEGENMIPILQLNCNELSFKPNNLEKVAFITFFVHPKNLPFDGEQNGDGWVLREYDSVDELIPIEKPNDQFPILSFEMKTGEIKDDYPQWDSEDIPENLRDIISDLEEFEEITNYFDEVEMLEGVKVGGYPNYSQSGPSMGMDFAIQIDSSEKCHWMWGDSGMAFLFRDIDSGQWYFHWDCY